MKEKTTAAEKKSDFTSLKVLITIVVSAVVDACDVTICVSIQSRRPSNFRKDQNKTVIFGFSVEKSNQL